MPNMVRPVDQAPPANMLVEADGGLEEKRKKVAAIMARRALEEKRKKVAEIMARKQQGLPDPDVPVPTDGGPPIDPTTLKRPEPKDFYPPLAKPRPKIKQGQRILGRGTGSMRRAAELTGVTGGPFGPAGGFTEKDRFGNMLQGYTWDTSDEIGAWMSALHESVTKGGSPSKHYDVIKPYLQERRKQYSEANFMESLVGEAVPAIATGNLLRSVGQKALTKAGEKAPKLAKTIGQQRAKLAPALEKMPKSALWMARYMKKAAPILGEAAAYGLAAGEEGERLESAGQTAAGAGALKAAGDVIGTGVGAVVDQMSKRRIVKELGQTEGEYKDHVQRILDARSLAGVPSTREEVIKELGEYDEAFTPANIAAEEGSVLRGFYKMLVGQSMGGGKVRKQTADKIAELERLVAVEEIAADEVARKSASGEQLSFKEEKVRLNSMKDDRLREAAERYDKNNLARAAYGKQREQQAQVGAARDRALLGDDYAARAARSEGRESEGLAEVADEFDPQLEEVETGYARQKADIESEYLRGTAADEDRLTQRLQTAQDETDIAEGMLANERSQLLADKRKSAKFASAAEKDVIDRRFRQDVQGVATPPGAGEEFVEKLRAAGPRDAVDLLQTEWGTIGWPEVNDRSYAIDPEEVITDILSGLKGRQDDSAGLIENVLRDRLVPYTKNGSISGVDLMDARNALRAEIAGKNRSQNPASNIAKSAVDKGVKRINKLLKSGMDEGEKLSFDARLRAYGNMKGMESAAFSSKLKGGEYDQKDWINARAPQRRKETILGKFDLQSEADAGIRDKDVLDTDLEELLGQIGRTEAKQTGVLTKSLQRDTERTRKAAQDKATREKAQDKATYGTRLGDLEAAKKGFMAAITSDKERAFDDVSTGVKDVLGDIAAQKSQALRTSEAFEAQDLGVLAEGAKEKAAAAKRRNEGVKKRIASEIGALSSEAEKTKYTRAAKTPAQQALADASAAKPQDNLLSRGAATTALAMGGGVLGAPFFAMGIPEGMAATMLTGATTAQALSMPSVQRALSGQTEKQKTIAKFLREYRESDIPELLMQLRRTPERLAAEEE